MQLGQRQIHIILPSKSRRKAIVIVLTRIVFQHNLQLPNNEAELFILQHKPIPCLSGVKTKYMKAEPIKCTYTTITTTSNTTPTIKHKTMLLFFLIASCI